MAKPTRFPPAMGAVEPLHIFQDDILDNAAPMVSHAPMPTTKFPRKALQPANTNLIMNPPHQLNTATKSSPLKSRPKCPLTPLRNSKNPSKLNMVSLQPPSFGNRQHTDSMQKNKAPVMSRFKTVSHKPLAPAMPTSLSFDSAFGPGKENAHPLMPAPTQSTAAFKNMDLDSFSQHLSRKRTLLDAAPIKDSRPSKKVKLEDDSIPPYDSFPQPVDDGTKPPHSYATLIGMAILRSPNRRLTLAQIYKWISDAYSFYNATDAGWQNSIRHNLSLNKAFIKQERPKDDKGKGNYWAIEPGMEVGFLKEKPTRKSGAAATTTSTTATPANSDGAIQSAPPAQVSRLDTHQPRSSVQNSPLPPTSPKVALPALPQPTSTAAVNEPSSDATIPCPVSENAAPEEPQEKLDFDRALDFYSPINAAIQSSPPIPRHIDRRSGTPPPILRIPASSISRSHKRQVASMDDSGYISSLESSAMRPNKNTNALTSEADRPQSKRGRSEVGSAEAEIRRIRSSSYDSPTRVRSSYGAAPPSSSPFHTDSGQMLPPLTPAMKMKAPRRPPPSVSPNTNLRNHRDKVRSMLNSPLRRVSVISDESLSWSPAFNLENTVYSYNDYTLDAPEFDVFQDMAYANAPQPMRSPVKRSMKKARLDRSQSANALGDITNSASQRKSITSAPFLEGPSLLSHMDSPSLARFDNTPSKVLAPMPMQSPRKHSFFNIGSPSRAPAGSENLSSEWLHMDEFQGSEFLSDDLTDLGGLDILQGFEKIGGASSQATVQAHHMGTHHPQ